MEQMTTPEVIDALEQVWGSILEVTEDLTEDQWRLETPCPGWDVADNVSHLIGFERGIEGESAPAIELSTAAHVKTDIGVMNERWVEERRSWTGDEVRAEFALVTQRRLATLRSLPETAFDEVGWSPIGQVPMRTFMLVRIMDSWLHEQDIRDALGRPGGTGGLGEQVTIARADLALGVIVGKGARAPEGSSVALVIDGPRPVRRRFEIVGGRATPIEADEATATITLAPATYVRRFGGRITTEDALAAEGTSLEGDRVLGAAVVTAMAVMI